MKMWHTLGTKLQAHAKGLQAYHRVYNENKVDKWNPKGDVNGERGGE
jgi:hypothetical protein